MTSPFSLSTPPLFAALAPARNVLIAGAGGGFDVYAGLPLAVSLWDAGVEAHLANLAFSQLELLDLDVWLAENVAAVTPEVAGLEDYFPERTLARWLAAHDLPSTVYAFPRLGVQPLRAAYRALVDHLGVDAVVLVDGGTDILMRGDETVGVVLLRRDGDIARILLDYVTPRYRDFTPGEFVWRRSGLLGDLGFRHVMTPPHMVDAYYDRVGFTSNGREYVLDL